MIGGCNLTRWARGCTSKLMAATETAQDRDHLLDSLQNLRKIVPVLAVRNSRCASSERPLRSVSPRRCRSGLGLSRRAARERLVSGRSGRANGRCGRSHNPKVAGSNPAPATEERARKSGPFLLGRSALAGCHCSNIVPICFGTRDRRQGGGDRTNPESPACGASRLTAGTGAHGREHRLDDLFELV